jgi:hypothetical protein
MSTADDPLELRRAQFRDAVRRDDALATARAAARLRAHARDLGARDLETVRAARQMFGRAIRDARVRRAFGSIPLEPAIAIPLRRPRRIPYALATTIVVVVLAFGAVLAQPLLDASEQDGGGGGAPAAVPSDAPILVSALSRGRVVLAEVAVAPAIAEPAPTAEPEPSASASPAPTSGAGAAIGSAAPSGSGGPGSGTGSGSGSGSGAGTRSPSPAPTATRSPAPTFAACFVSIQRGFARLCGQVIDAQTGRGIAGACVSLGACTDQSARTDPNGRWAFVLPVGNGSLQWGLEFAMPGYRTASYTQTSRQGFITIPTQRLVAAP